MDSALLELSFSLAQGVMAKQTNEKYIVINFDQCSEQNDELSGKYG